MRGNRETSMRVVDLAIRIADDVARADVESYAQLQEWPVDGPSVYRLDKSCWEVDGAIVRGETEEDVAKAIADAQRAARYIELRMPDLPYVMHRDPADPNRVWFTDKE